MSDTGEAQTGGHALAQSSGQVEAKELPAPLTSSWKTPQFWAVLVSAVIGVLVGLGYLGPDFAKSHEQLVNALALLASLLAPAIYAVARAISTHGHQQAVATVMAARATANAAIIGPPVVINSAPPVVNVHTTAPSTVDVGPAPPAKKTAAKTSSGTRGR